MGFQRILFGQLPRNLISGVLFDTAIHVDVRKFNQFGFGMVPQRCALDLEVGLFSVSL